MILRIQTPDLNYETHWETRCEGNSWWDYEGKVSKHSARIMASVPMCFIMNQTLFLICVSLVCIAQFFHTISL